MSTKSYENAVGARYDKVARFYDGVNLLLDRFLSWHRRRLLRLGTGRVLEVGVGTGTASRTTPPGGRIAAVDVSREMLREAEDRRERCAGTIELGREDVQNLPFEDESFASAFSSFVFCSVTDPVKGLREVRRVLKKGDQLLMLEHVRSRNRMLGRLMDEVNRLVVRSGVDNINRDTVEYLRDVGFKIVQERNILYDVVKVIVATK